MPRPTIWTHATPARKTETRTIRDPNLPGWELTLTLRGQLRPGKDAAYALRDEWIRRYVTGLVDARGQVIEPPKRLAIDEVEDARVDASLCYWAAFLNVMHVGDEIDRPDIAEVAGWRLKMDQGWQELCDWAWGLNNPDPLPSAPESGESDSPSSGDTTNTPGSPSFRSATSVIGQPVSSGESG